MERRAQKSPLYPSGSPHLNNLLLTSSSGGNFDQVDIVRSQIPLLGGGSQSGAAMEGGGSAALRRSAQLGENVVKIRILEQENERFLRKIRGLEAQLSELERVHGVRIQELLGE